MFSLYFSTVKWIQVEENSIYNGKRVFWLYLMNRNTKLLLNSLHQINKFGALDPVISNS